MTETSTINAALAANVAQQPDKPALGTIWDGVLVWVTWEQLHGQVQKRVAELGEQGFSGGDAVEENRSNEFDWIVHTLAVMRIGATLVPPGFDGRLPGEPPPATVVTTSGTGAEPRRVMLSHENLLANARALSEASGGSGDELRLTFLPFHHLYARTGDLHIWLLRGSRLVLAESRETVFRDCQIVHPTVVNGVPYFFQKAIDLADAQGLSLRELFGGEIKRCYCGGAALAPAVERRFFDEGVPLYTGYGLTEASPVVTVNTPDTHKLGTVGKPLPGVEVRTADDGEVLVRGPNVMLGYWNNPEPTAEVLKDGWLHTGDLGSLDEEGFLTITGRKKELVVLSTGKNVAPSRVEAMLAASPWIEQACVIGDGEKGLRALVVPSRDRLRALIKRERLWVWSKRRAVSHPRVREVFREAIDGALTGAAREEQVHDFFVLPRGFSQELGEMTAKLSLRREVIRANFARQIQTIDKR
ncbi:AMP-dependent synthetase/ligase [Pseudobythopirellula maris]|uniref:AMP-dependent synthetase/ligase n=1 Tax=Pseudobythopirellula maris TaxID=2527991 RepID=UPI0018D49197|nr:AMP-dependent synthetase/ligase [Pseudobythopirellula maris]